MKNYGAITDTNDVATKGYVDEQVQDLGSVKYNAEQSLTTAQKAQARENIDAASPEDIDAAIGYAIERSYPNEQNA